MSHTSEGFIRHSVIFLVLYFIEQKGFFETKLHKKT